MCEYCSVDHAGRLSLIAIFDRIVVPALPVQMPLLFVVTRWRADGESRFVAETRLWTPTEQLAVTSGPVQVIAAPGMPHVTINQFHGLTFERAGQYLVELLAEGETARYYPWQLSVQDGLRPPPTAAR
jgi:hypothetical protein